MFENWIERTEWSRKETIFLLKMHYWLQHTSYGILDELKYYGEERTFLEYFRADREESHPFIENYLHQGKSISIHIQPISR
jgi:hypothetical protein